MELKYALNKELAYQQNGSNRTFMELKYIYFVIYQICYFVLIVPLWNWNMENQGGSNAPALRSNRTFMELKWIRF